MMPCSQLERQMNDPSFLAQLDIVGRGLSARGMPPDAQVLVVMQGVENAEPLLAAGGASGAAKHCAWCDAEAAAGKKLKKCAACRKVSWERAGGGKLGVGRRVGGQASTGTRRLRPVQSWAAEQGHHHYTPPSRTPPAGALLLPGVPTRSLGRAQGRVPLNCRGRCAEDEGAAAARRGGGLQHLQHLMPS